MYSKMIRRICRICAALGIVVGTFFITMITINTKHVHVLENQTSSIDSIIANNNYQQLSNKNLCKVSHKLPNPSNVSFPPVVSSERIRRYDGCLRYSCAPSTEPHCSQAIKETTNYHDGDKPPCCIHILRDILQVIDTLPDIIRVD